MGDRQLATHPLRAPDMMQGMYSWTLVLSILTCAGLTRLSGSHQAKNYKSAVTKQKKELYNTNAPVVNIGSHGIYPVPSRAWTSRSKYIPSTDLFRGVSYYCVP